MPLNKRIEHDIKELEAKGFVVQHDESQKIILATKSGVQFEFKYDADGYPFVAPYLMVNGAHVSFFSSEWFPQQTLLDLVEQPKVAKGNILFFKENDLPQVNTATSQVPVKTTQEKQSHLVEVDDANQTPIRPSK